MIPVIDGQQLLIVIIGLILMIVPSVICIIYKTKGKLIIVIINIILIVLGLISPMITAVGWSALLIFVVPMLLRYKTIDYKDKQNNSSKDAKGGQNE